MFLFIIQVLSINMTDVQSITKSIEDLQKKTKFKTFYELFNVSENASISQIKTNFRRLIKSSDTLDMPRDEYETLVTMGYQILLNNKQEYGYLLSLKFIDFIRQNFYVYLFSSFVLAVFVVFVADLAFVFANYMRVKVRAQQMDRKAARMYLRKNAEYASFSLEKMLTARMFRFVFQKK